MKNKKLQLRKMCLLFAICWFIYSCENNQDLTPTIEDETTFMVDLQKINKSQFIILSENEDVDLISIEGLENQTNEIYYFTDETLLLSWLDQQPQGKELYEKFSDMFELRDYAIHNDVITEFEKNGVVSEDFLSRQNKLTTNRTAIVGFIQFYKDFDGRGSSFVAGLTLPILPSLNNDISSYNGIGTAILCDKIFYRGSKKAIASDGQFARNLTDFNNKASSVF
jgi:hypothetical protein